MNPIAGDILMHYGMPRRSGRYPWGSGKDPNQRTGDFLSRIDELKKSGWTETPENIKEAFGMNTTEFRKQKSLAKNERRAYQVARAKSLREDGLSTMEIGRKMGVNESTVRSWFNEESARRMSKAQETANFIKEQINKKGMIDVGKGVELELGISREKLDQALKILEDEGYPIYGGRVPQATNPNQKTTLKVICPPGTEHKNIYEYDKINSLHEYITRDGGNTYEKKFTYPSSMDSKRLMIRYSEDGGLDKDGIVELRRGVADLSLGNSHYSQVRILVDGTHYIKGMAVYSDNMPDGVDVVFNTNKTKKYSKLEVLKEIKDDPDNPFGSAIKDVEQGGQYWYNDPKTGERKLGLINKRADEGDWSEWKDKLPSQFLSKQSIHMAKKQLGLAIDDKKAELNDILSLNNPVIKKKFLMDFADDCDSAAVHLQAAALPGQKYRVIIPVNTLKDTEIYAPMYDDGTKLALIRYPHGGTFEIPILTVNNKNAAANKILGKDVTDAVAINKKTADRLSGADFDGDTVMCIPTHDAGGRVRITSTPMLKGLENFECKDVYGPDKKVVDSDGNEHYYRNGVEYRLMAKGLVQKEMGTISNLITDMTLQGANTTELAAAVRHSMVVIDANKHHLDYKSSEIDNNIAALKKRYQGGGGAYTLISKSKGEVQVDKRQGTPKVNIKGKEWYDPSKPEGSLIYKVVDDIEYNVAKVNRRSKSEPNGTIQVSDKGKRYVQFDDDPDKWVPIEGKSTLQSGERVHSVVITKRKHQPVTNMENTDDARTLISEANTPMERIYADYANAMKSMANNARIQAEGIGKIARSPSAAKTYANEVKSLTTRLMGSEINAPRERKAQLLTNAEIKAKKEANPNMTKEDIKKASQQALSKYRTEVGSVSRKDRAIHITDKEWEAIQAGAVSENVLTRILNHADKDDLRQLATPRSANTLNKAQINRVKALAANNYSIAEIAKKMGKSPSTISTYLKGVN